MLPVLGTFSGALALLLSATIVSAKTSRGLAWATDSRFAKVIGSKPQIKWYHHWQDGPLKEMPGKVEFVPMFWGAKKWDKWNKRKKEMYKRKPKYLLGFNEPDIRSQGDMNPAYAADVWMKEIHHWGKKGVKLGSPAIAWDLNWLAKFLKELKKRGGYVDFITVHWYGSHRDIGKFKKFIKAGRARFGRDMWVTELGVTSASRPSKGQAKNFMINAFNWMDKTGYVKRASWFGCFQDNKPPDAYATGKNALLTSQFKLNDMGNWYVYAGNAARRSLQSRHHRIAQIAARAEEETVDTSDAVDCDEICQLREASIDEYLNSPEARDVKLDDVVDCDEICQLREASIDEYLNSPEARDEEVEAVAA